MLTRSLMFFSLAVAVALFGAAQIDAQPGKGLPPGKGPGKGPEGGADIKKLESDLDRLLAEVKEAQAKLDKAKEQAKGKGGFEGFGKGKGFGKGFEGKKKDEPKKEAGKGGPEKLDPETIKAKYEYYKKLYDELPKTKELAKGGFGPKGGFGYWGMGRGGFGGYMKKEAAPTPPATTARSTTGSIEARIDRLIRELEALRNEVKKK